MNIDDNQAAWTRLLDDNQAAWTRLLDYLTNKQWAVFHDKQYSTPTITHGFITPDAMLELLADLPSDSFIVVSDKGFSLLTNHVRYSGDAIVKLHEDGILRYHTYTLLRSKEPIRIQSCCAVSSCKNYFTEDIVICAPEDITILW